MPRRCMGAHAALPRRAGMSRRELMSGGRTRRARAGRQPRRTRRRCRTAPLSWRTCAVARTGPRCRPRRATRPAGHMHVCLPLLLVPFHHAPQGRNDDALPTAALTWAFCIDLSIIISHCVNHMGHWIDEPHMWRPASSSLSASATPRVCARTHGDDQQSGSAWRGSRQIWELRCGWSATETDWRMQAGGHTERGRQGWRRDLEMHI